MAIWWISSWIIWERVGHVTNLLHLAMISGSENGGLSTWLHDFAFVTSALWDGTLPIGSMYGIYANIWGILMGSMLPYLAYMDPMCTTSRLYIFWGYAILWRSPVCFMGKSVATGVSRWHGGPNLNPWEITEMDIPSKNPLPETSVNFSNHTHFRVEPALSLIWWA